MAGVDPIFADSLLDPASVPLLRSLTAEEIARIVGKSLVQVFEPGEALLVQGEKRDQFFILLSGMVRVTAVSSDGTTHVLADLAPGACMGEMSLLTGDSASATATALSACKVLGVSRQVFDAALDAIPGFGRNLGAVIASRLRRTNTGRMAQDEGAFLPLIAAEADRAAATVLLARLAQSVARHTGRRVLQIDTRRDQAVAGTGTLPGLATLLRSRARLQELERAAEERGAGVVVIDGTLDAADRSAADALLAQLAGLFRHVVAALPADGPAQPLSSAKALRILFLAGPEAQEAAVRAAAGDRARLRLLLAAEAAVTEGERRRISREHGGIHARVIPGLAEAARGSPGGAPFDQEIDRLARDATGLLVGIALGAGGTRGFAHLGVLESLRRLGVPDDAIAGTSIGANIGTLWAFRHPPGEILKMLLATRNDLIRYTFPVRSLLSNAGIRGHIQRNARDRRFEDSPIPLAVVAADIHEGREVVLTEGPLWPAILASSSIPGVFPPVEIDGRFLVDGGIYSPVPTAAAAALGTQVVIAVKLGGDRKAPPPGQRRPYRLLSSIQRTTEVMQGRINDDTAARSQVLIAPQLEGSTTSMHDFDRAEELLALGEAAAEQALPRLRAVLPWLRSS